ncbi:MAG: hypothetical protein IJP35_05585 [Clostridia bacterium]|nr:hypothetical protein [Clostridia bacterium]
MKMTKRLLSVLLAVAMVLTGLVGTVTTQAATAFTANTDADTPIYHLGIENASVVDGNYTHYRYFAQEFVPQESTLGGAKLAMNLTAGTATVHLELRSDVNGAALASFDTDITSKGNGMNWYDISLGSLQTVTPGNVYYLVYWLKARTSTSVCVVHGKTGSFTNPAYAWKMSDGSATPNFTKEGFAVGFELITTELSVAGFTSWTAENTSPIHHLALQGAPVTDANYNNYSYAAQTFVPLKADLYGVKVALNLTTGVATAHIEIRSALNGSAIASNDVSITSQGNGKFWYDLPLASKLTVTPGQKYYAVFYLTARDAGSVCIVYGSDVGAGGAAYPGCSAKLSAGATALSEGAGNVIYNFELLTAPVSGGGTTPGVNSFTSWTQEGAPVTHLGLSTAAVTDGNWLNYRYVAQEFIPAKADLWGAKVAVNLTAGDATFHVEIRSNVNGAAIASNDVYVTSKGNGRNWYNLPLKDKITVTPGQKYYLVYYLIARTESSVCVVYASDVGANGAEYPGYQWRMADGGNVTFDSGANNLVFCFEIAESKLPDPEQPPQPTDPTDEEVAAPVIEMIQNIPANADLACEDMIKEARAAYDNLTDAQKKLVTNLPSLEAAEKRIADLKAADAVEKQIDALTKGDTEGIAAARKAYEDLTDDQKAFVTNLAKLEALEKGDEPIVGDVTYGDVDGDTKITATDALEVLKSVVGKTELTAAQFKAADVSGDGKVGADDALLILQYVVGKIDHFPVEENDPDFFKQAAADVDAKIDAIGEVTEENYLDKTDAITGARKAYNELSDEAKALVTKLDVLVAAEEAWATFKEIDDNKVPQPEDPANPVIEEGYAAIPQLQGVSGYATPVAPITSELAFNTLTQINQSYSKLYDLDIDCILAYEYGMPSDNTGGLAASWLESKHTYSDNATIGMMIAVNRDNGEYLENYGRARGVADIQTQSNGQLRSHSVLNSKTVYYMVPTNAYMDYKWQVIDAYLASGKISVVALEEPELWNNAGYSAGYKELFKQHYGVDWMDPNSSAQATWMHQQFKAWAFKNAFEVLSGKIKAKYPDVKVLITTHNPLSYMHHGISTGAAMYSDIDTVDGVIGQTWSDDASQAFTYAGNRISNVFMNAMYAYNSYGELLSDGQTLYLLQDPSSDNGSIPQEEKEENWKQTVVAAMMQNDTTSFQSTIWPQRAFTAMGMDYKTVQLSVNKMYQEFGNDDMYGAVYGATPGVALATSDSMGWHLGENNVITGSSKDSFSGIYYSLQNDGVAVDTVGLDNLTNVNQLKDVKLLIVAYDAIKPLSETANQVIADWVKAGGRLLMVGGHDAFAGLTSEWWGKKGTTPYKDLIAKMGLSMNVAVGGIAGGKVPVWSGSSFDGNCGVPALHAGSTLSFSGSGFSTFMTLDGKNVGVDATVGKGKATIVGLPSCYYARTMSTEKVIRELCAKALSGSGIEYKAGTSFVAVRGNYFAYYSPVDASRTAENRTFINLLHPNLEVVPGGTAIPRAEAVLYYDVTHQDNDDIPRFCFTGGTETGERFQTADITRFTITNPSNSVAASLVLGNGRYPQTVTAVSASGKEISFITNWDEYTEALIIKANNPDVNDPITFEITWGDEYVQLPTNFVYDSFTHFTTKNTIGNDRLLNSYNGFTNDGVYVAEGGTEFVWKIDLNTYKQAAMTFDILANYHVLVSFDGNNWTTVENWADKGGPVGNLADGSYVPGASNRTDVTVNSNDYDGAATASHMYVKMTSCYMYTPEHPGGDHGGQIYSYTLTYLTPA